MTPRVDVSLIIFTFQLAKLLILCSTALSANTNNGQTTFLTSPCPDVFEYEGEPQWDRWYGVVTFSSNVELVGLTYKIQLDRPAHLMVTWDGEVRTDDNTGFSVFNPYHFQRAGEVMKSRIMVKYNPNDGPVPQVVKIVINGIPTCPCDDKNVVTLNGNSESAQVNERPDPIFADDALFTQKNNLRNQNVHQHSDPVAVVGYDTKNGQSASSSANVAGPGNRVITSSKTVPVSKSPSSPSSPASNQLANKTRSTDIINRTPADTSRQQDTRLNNLDNNAEEQIPFVTTLTLPNNQQNRTSNNHNNNNNMDSIVQLIKNKLEQAGTLTANNTIILTVVSPAASNAAVESVHAARHRNTATETPNRQANVSPSNKSTSPNRNAGSPVADKPVLSANHS